MSSHYFKKLQIQARKIDDGISKLTEIWELPNVLIGCLAKQTDETNSRIEAIRSLIESRKSEIKETLTIQDENYEDMNEFLDEVSKQYNTIKESCNDLENVFTDYGYHYSANDSLDNKTANSSVESCGYNSTQEEKLEVEFTPDLGWYCKAKTNEGLRNSQNSNYTLEESVTPEVIHSSSILKTHLSVGRNKSEMCTPARERPRFIPNNFTNTRR